MYMFAQKDFVMLGIKFGVWSCIMIDVEQQPCGKVGAGLVANALLGCNPLEGSFDDSAVVEELVDFHHACSIWEESN